MQEEKLVNNIKKITNILVFIYSYLKTAKNRLTKIFIFKYLLWSRMFMTKVILQFLLVMHDINKKFTFMKVILLL